ncbi:MAG: prepilin-type N-terminal cleavage/methylation domain-containing protein [Desulfosoma sp.]
MRAIRGSSLNPFSSQAVGRFGKRAPSKAFRGFTLVEVLVAMALTAMVVTLLGTAMRSGLLSWRKLGLENQADIFSYAVPASLGRYVEFMATEATPWKGREGHLFPLCGSARGITFYSTYGPAGSSRQGLRLIGYLYDPSQNTLDVYDVDILEKEGEETDLLALAKGLLEGRDNVGPPMSRYGDVTEFRVAYGDTDSSDGAGQNLLWQDQWACEENPRAPRGVRLVFGVRSGASERVTSWIFPTRVP